MPDTITILQRIRFSTISPTEYKNESFFKTGFNLEAWEKRGQSCYWSKEGTSAQVRRTADSATLSRDETLDSDSYFNAFFLAHWLKLTSVRNFGLRIRLSGRARISIQAHTHLAEAQTLVSAEVNHATEGSWEASIPQSDVPASAIRLSFIVTALSKTATVHGGEWYTTDAPSQAVSVAVIIPTYNRANFARKAVSSLLADAAVQSEISRLLLIEQSDRAELADLAGGKCVYLRQGNLGGAGGFARGMYECITDGSLGSPTHLLLMDDDIMIETDSVLRVIRMAEYSTGNHVLGGGMLDLFKPNMAVALGEFNDINEYGFLELDRVYADADMARPSTLNIASLPQAEGYCAWWFCFFPIQVVHKIGFPIPCFFRGDDLQFGGRAKQAGFEPYMIPGIGLWHLPFAHKSVPWVNYFARYNDLVCNALRGGSQVDRFFAYSIYEIRALVAAKAVDHAAAAVKALEDYLRGWEHYRDRSFPAFLSEVKTSLVEYSATDQSPATVAKLKIRGTHVESRASAALARYQTQALRLQKGFVQNMPRVYSPSAWAPYFRSGSMKHLGQPAPKEPVKAACAYEVRRNETRPGTVLQRIRWGELSHVSYQNEDFFKSGFDAAHWQRSGRSCYWSAERSSPGIQHEASRIRLNCGQELYADSYFNAFFVGYWHALTSLQTVGLRLRFSGKLSLRVLGHTASAGEETLVNEETPADTSVWEVRLAPALLLGSIFRLSFSVRALSDQAELLGGEWFTLDAPVRPVSLAVITPTYNRPHFARKTVGDLLSDPDVAEVIHRVVVVEQSDQPELSDLDAAKCYRIRQPNYGCAGGVTRGIYECLEAESLKPATHFLFLDDDIMVEADSLLRAARFAAYATGNQVLGGGMLDLFKPNHAVALGESLERKEAGYYAISQLCPAADVARGGTLDFASIPRPEGYCAWWFCMVPRSLVEAIALPWAGFLRWDDINYGVRAAAAGYLSYMIPGIAVWHVPFYSKTVPWITYFDRYNELIQNALMSQAAVDAHIGHVIQSARNCAQSGALAVASAMTLAVEHYAAGWSHYASRTFPSFLGEVKAFVAGHEQIAKDGDDAQKQAAIEALALRLQAVEVRCQSESGVLREAFATKIPGTYTVDSWRSFFQHGNLLEQGSVRPIGAPVEDRQAVALCVA